MQDCCKELLLQAETADIQPIPAPRYGLHFLRSVGYIVLTPCLAQDRYKELLRLSRQWNNLKLRKWAGYGHKPDDPVSEGGLVNFCPACPQPGINLPDGWEEDPEQ